MIHSKDKKGKWVPYQLPDLALVDANQDGEKFMLTVRSFDRQEQLCVFKYHGGNHDIPFSAVHSVVAAEDVLSRERTGALRTSEELVSVELKADKIAAFEKSGFTVA